MKEAKCILQDVLILEPGRRIELITVHAQSKRVVEFHFSLKCPLLFIYLFIDSYNVQGREQ